MATDKKNEKELTVEDRLKALYKLQTYLSEIDRIRFMRGELPHEVKDLEDEIEGINTRIKNYQAEVVQFKKDIQAKTAEIKDRQAKITKYTAQQDNVRNNREFDFLNKEIEYEGLSVELAQKGITDLQKKMEQKKAEIERAQEELTDREHILTEKRGELEEIVSETRQQEEQLLDKAKALEPMVDTYTLNAFKRIRKNARNGLGIVTVERNACGGCFNRIPPQRQLEIKMHKKIIVCEYCGRIMIDSALASDEIEEKSV